MITFGSKIGLWTFVDMLMFALFTSKFEMEKFFQGGCKTADFQAKKKLVVPIPKSFLNVLISHKNKFFTASI